MRNPSFITRSIFILSLVSLFTDVSSEMLYPVMPVYLREIGFSVLLIGILEGFAEGVAGLSKGYFGKLSDSAGVRVPFVRLGYFLSALSKPMMAAFSYPGWIFSARTLDRLGKGLRTGARDALLSDEATAENKGKVFGFHRSMDTLGAVLGPSLALLFLYYYPGQYKLMFVLAVIPGLLGVCGTFMLWEKFAMRKTGQPSYNIFAFLHYWRDSPPAYKKLVIGLLAFALINSSDVFLLLMMKHNGLSDTELIGVYIFYNLSYAVMAFPLGVVGDRIGLLNTLILGLSIFCVVYAGMSVGRSIPFYLGLFFLYGVYAAATEGISRALISNLTNRRDTATAIGTYAAFTSLMALLSGSLAGFIWYQWGPAVLFTFASVSCVFIIAYLVILKPRHGL
ncbi:MAG TPA: MFS transporter [Sphingobacteriaceae bacterium]